ncbi:hypothetical protein A4S06_03830 [Erysipelotrichaceae bacterium MTC7]|nr:hypothetical protein A4S06_03830 [Erysipelotrichaceae bacterium MTC7]
MNALITGTTSGIGYELAKLFAKDGFDLILVSRNKVKLENQKQELEQTYGIQVTTYALDLSQVNAARLLKNEIKEPIHALVNNAGFMEYGDFVESDPVKQREMIQLQNLFLTVMTQYYLPDMVKYQYGYILNVASMAAFVGLPKASVYGAVKAYILSFTKGIHSECKHRKVKISALCPGATHTLFAKKSDAEDTNLFTGYVMDASQVAAIAYRGLQKNKVIIIPGLYNKVGHFLTKCMPYALVDKVVTKIMRK